MADQPYMPVKAKTVEWETPDSIFGPLDSEFRFTLDAAASDENYKCDKHFTKEQDGLSQSWKGETVWLNPPYDVKSLSAFTEKVLHEAKTNNVTTVMLVPVKSDQQWFHDLWDLRGNVDKKCNDWIEFRWIRGRVSFVGAPNSCTFPSVVIVVHGMPY